MGRVMANISMSLDGFVAGPGAGAGNPLGDGGERLHQWVYGLESWREAHGLEGGVAGRDAEVVEEAVADTGAVVMGRRMFDCGEGPWGEEPPFHTPVFVLTHRAREPLARAGGTTFTFVTEGVDTAVRRAREAAGGRSVSVAGGAEAIGQCLAAGLLDEIQIHLVPVLLGAGTRLFAVPGAERAVLERTRVVDSPAVTHLRYRVLG